jgi:hypothetical protein
MDPNIEQLLTLIDNVKEKLSTGEYKDISDTLMSVHKTMKKLQECVEELKESVEDPDQFVYLENKHRQVRVSDKMHNFLRSHTSRYNRRNCTLENVHDLVLDFIKLHDLFDDSGYVDFSRPLGYLLRDLLNVYEEINHSISEENLHIYIMDHCTW